MMTSSNKSQFSLQNFLTPTLMLNLVAPRDFWLRVTVDRAGEVLFFSFQARFHMLLHWILSVSAAYAESCPITQFHTRRGKHF